MKENRTAMNNIKYQPNEKREIKFTHPGIILNKEILKGRRISQKELATEANIPYQEVKNICQGKKDIDKNIAQKLAAFFGVNKDFWINLQNHYNSVSQKEFNSFEVIEAKEIEKDKSCQITLRVGYKELKEIFPNQWKEIRTKAKQLLI